MESDLARVQAGAMSSSKQMQSDHANESKGIDNEAKKATTLETRQRLLKAEVNTEKRDIGTQEKSVANEAENVKKVREKYTGNQKLAFFLILAIFISFLAVLGASSS